MQICGKTSRRVQKLGFQVHRIIEIFCMGIFSLLLHTDVRCFPQVSWVHLGGAEGSSGKEAQLDENKPQRGAFGFSISFLLSRCFLGITDPCFNLPC